MFTSYRMSFCCVSQNFIYAEYKFKNFEHYFNVL